MKYSVIRTLAFKKAVNFIQLAQRLGRECGVAGAISSTQNQKGEFQRLVDWINQAWVEIQLEREWDFRHADMPPYQLTVGVNKYSAADFGIADFESWDIGTGEGIVSYNDITQSGLLKNDSSVRIFKESKADEVALPYIDYPHFRALYEIGQQTNGRPVVFSVGRDNSLLFAPTPDYAYTVQADYIAGASEMTENLDVPNMPTSLHMMIVYRAMQFYGGYEDASDVFSRGTIGYTKMMVQLDRIQKPRIVDATGSLA